MQDTLLAGRFRIVGRVGSGGMGEVWSALDERMQREVAVKLVQALPSMGEVETQIRFRREVQLAGRLSHRNIVTVHDWGEVTVGGRETLYLVMELVSGISLRQRLKESVPPWTLAAGWAGQIAQGLHAAHRAGVVHRDIKPANVLLTPDGTVKVLDFGVAKFMGDTMRVNELTATGRALGSPPYMSPEQAQGDREVDHRSDLYSLGCLLYHAVTGRPPFVGTNELAVLLKQIRDTPTAPNALAPDIPEALNDLILTLLAKRPEDRPADAAAVYEALGGMLLDHAAALPAEGPLDSAHLGHADALAGRMLEKAWEIRRRAEKEATALIEQAEAEAAAHARAAAGAEELVAQSTAKAAAESELIIERAQKEAASLREAAQREAQQRREEADALFEETRAKAAQAAADFGTNLAKRREQVERDLVVRQAKAEKRLAEIEHRAEQLRLEAETLRTDTERRARRTLETAQRQAEDILADVNAKADRIRGESERELAALTSRRDSISAQLTNVRQLLAQFIEDGSLERALPQPQFELVRRGYDPEQVDAYVHHLRQGGDGPEPGFTLVRRGYDRGQVDTYITTLKRLTGRTGSTPA